jgi:phosphate transport system permease protein
MTEATSTLPVMIYKLATSPYEDQNQLGWAAGLVLIGMVLTANILARMILARGVSVPRG